MPEQAWLKYDHMFIDREAVSVKGKKAHVKPIGHSHVCQLPTYPTEISILASIFHGPVKSFSMHKDLCDEWNRNYNAFLCKQGKRMIYRILHMFWMPLYPTITEPCS